MYKITFHKRAKKQLYKIEKYSPKKVDRINEIINSLSKNPFDSDSFDIKKIEDDPLACRCRIGRYRIVYAVYKYDKILDIRRVEHRQWNYKKIYSFFSL